MGTQTGLTVPVVFETTYTWRVVADDPYGGASTGAWMSFIVHLANQPPNPIIYLSAATLVTRSTSTVPGLAKSTGRPPTGTLRTYSLCSLDQNRPRSTFVQQGTQTAYTLNFQFGTTYYWRVFGHGLISGLERMDACRPFFSRGFG